MISSKNKKISGKKKLSYKKNYINFDRVDDGYETRWLPENSSDMTFIMWCKPHVSDGTIGIGVHNSAGNARFYMGFTGYRPWLGVGETNNYNSAPINFEQVPKFENHDDSYTLTWHQIVITLDGNGEGASGTASFYWDGKLHGSFTYTGKNCTTPFRIGDVNNGVTPWQRWLGAIGDIAVYDRTFTANEVKMDFKNESHDYTKDGAIHHWAMGGNPNDYIRGGVKNVLSDRGLGWTPKTIDQFTSAANWDANFITSASFSANEVTINGNQSIAWTSLRHSHNVIGNTVNSNDLVGYALQYTISAGSFRLFTADNSGAKTYMYTQGGSGSGNYQDMVFIDGTPGQYFGIEYDSNFVGTFSKPVLKRIKTSTSKAALGIGGASDGIAVPTWEDTYLPIASVQT